MHSNISGPTKAVCYREVSTIGGICYRRFHCTSNQGGIIDLSLQKLVGCLQPWKLELFRNCRY